MNTPNDQSLPYIEITRKTSDSPVPSPPLFCTTSKKNGHVFYWNWLWPRHDVREVKVKVTLVQALRLCTGRTAHRGSRDIALLFHDHGTEEGEGSASRPGRSLPPGKTRYALYRRLGGPQGWSGQVRKISPPPGFDPRTVQAAASRYPAHDVREEIDNYLYSGVEWDHQLNYQPSSHEQLQSAICVDCPQYIHRRPHT